MPRTRVKIEDNRYKVVLFTESGNSINYLFRWGFQAHKIGRSRPDLYIWYTIIRIRDNKVVCEMCLQESLYRNTPACWDNVTHAKKNQPYGSRLMRPDERRDFNNQAGDPPMGGSAVSRSLPKPIIVPLQTSDIP
jgi:hypothetical protein